MQSLENVKFSNIIYPKGATIVDAGTWTVGRISTGVRKFGGKYESIGFVANGNVNTGIDTKAKYNIKGHYENGKFGKQLVIQKMEMILNTKTLEGLEQALTLIMSELMAERMIEQFKTSEAVIEAFENKYSTEFMKIKGMTEGKLKGYYDLFEQRIQGQEAIVKLTPLGFTPKQAKEVYKKYKDMDLIMEMLENAGMYDFYIDGALYFEDADTIGRAMKIGTLNEKRIGALIVKYFKAPFQDESYFTEDQFNTYVIPYLNNHCGDGLNHRHIDSALNYLNAKKAIFEANKKIGLKVTHDIESEVYQLVMQLNNKLKHVASTPMNVIENVIKSAPFELSDEQSEAVRLACTNGISIISGNAGAGKSTTLAIITKVFQKIGDSIEQVALSGKAALRIEETTGLPAQTIHRMFYSVPRDTDTPPPNLANPYLNIEGLSIKKEVLILDEASMVGGTIMLNLLKLLNNSPKIKHIIIVGDDAQLPPIGVGQVFTDLLYYGNVPKVKLTKVYRQASESGILASATMVRQNQNFIPALSTFGKDFKHLEYAKGNEWIAEFKEMLENNNGDLLETQIITTTNEIATRTNVAVQKELDIFSTEKYTTKFKGIEFTIFVGSKVLLNENQYQTLHANGEENGAPVFNGSIGMVKKITEKYMVIDFAGIGEVGIERDNWNAIRLGYAITVHKSQGSGFNSVIAVINGASEPMLTTNMMYTAITRAKKECTLISQNENVDRCVKKSAAERQTWLPLFYGGKI